MSESPTATGAARRPTARQPGPAPQGAAPPPLSVQTLERPGDRWVSLMFSVLFHAALIGLLAYGWWTFHQPAPSVPHLAIDATVVDGRALARAQAAARSQNPTPPQTVVPPPQRPPAAPAPPEPQTVQPPPPAPSEGEQTVPVPPADQAPQAEREAQAARKAQEEADHQAQVEAEQRAEEAHRKAQAEAARKAEQQRQAEARAAQARREAEKREAEVRRQAEAKRLEEARREVEAQAAEQQQSEADLQRGLDAEQSAMRASGAVAPWKAQIRARIERAWIRPPTAREGINCEVYVTQVPGGEVVNVRLGACNGDEAVRQSILDAAYRASPLPAPPDPALFERDLIVIFKPTD